MLGTTLASASEHATECSLTRLTSQILFDQVFDGFTLPKSFNWWIASMDQVFTEFRLVLSAKYPTGPRLLS